MDVVTDELLAQVTRGRSGVATVAFEIGVLDILLTRNFEVPFPLIFWGSSFSFC